jgi:hypothetical protein
MTKINMSNSLDITQHHCDSIFQEFKRLDTIIQLLEDEAHKRIQKLLRIHQCGRNLNLYISSHSRRHKATKTNFRALDFTSKYGSFLRLKGLSRKRDASHFHQQDLSYLDCELTINQFKRFRTSTECDPCPVNVNKQKKTIFVAERFVTILGSAGETRNDPMDVDYFDEAKNSCMIDS